MTRSSRKSSLFPVVVDGVHPLPVLHERLEFADCVRRAFDVLEPDAVAVELPSSLESAWLRGVDRLPAISVLLYEDARGQTIFLPVHPADPMVEAARTARERGLPVACADLDVDGHADYRDAIPDSYTAVRLSPAELYRAFRRIPRPADPTDAAREASMAYHARRLRSEGAERVLLLCGMHHLEAVAKALERDQAIPLSRPVRKNVRLMHLHPDSLGEVLHEIPFYIAAYEARRKGLPPPPPPREPVAAGRTYGPFRVLSGGRGDDPDRVVDAVHRAARESGWASWESWIESEPPGPPPADREGTDVPGPLDRLKLQWSLLRESEKALEASAPDERVEAWQRINLARYSRNLALVQARLVVDLFDLLVAARGCVSENFAWETHRLAGSYPHQSEAATDLTTAKIRADELFDGIRRIRLTHRTPRHKRGDWHSLFHRKRLDERWAGEWLEELEGSGICSYPPEDVVVENFGRYLKERGKRILSEERARSVPFTTSVLDGIDVRETIRHLPEKQIWVRELGRIPGGVGSVAMIFDEDDEPGNERFPHAQTWLGEHDQESDMAFYCTEPAQGIAGPGICRVTYGGFLLSYPPRRMLEVWTDPDYRLAERKSEVLLLAALDYSEERVVIYVAHKPPRSIFQQIAGRLARKILYVPIGTLSPSTLRRIRVMHILSGREKRKIARDYVW